MNRPEDAIELLRHAYAVWHETRGHSGDHWMSLLDENISFWSPGGGVPQLVFSSDRSRRQAMRDYFSQMLRDWEMIHFTVHELIADGDRVVMYGTTAWRHTGTGKSFETRKVDLWRFRDGKAVEFCEFFDTATVQAAATP